MRYAYKDLGKQPAGSTVVVHWSGSAANVMLLDPVNFSRYQYLDGRPFFYDGGGRYRRSPARLSIPEDGRWYVVVDLRHYSSTAPTIEVTRPQEDSRREKKQRDKAGVAG